MKLLITPHSTVYREFIKENKSDQLNLLWVNSEILLRGLRIKHSEVIFGKDWFKIPGIKKALKTVIIKEKKPCLH